MQKVGSSKIIDRDVFLDDDCAQASDVMVRLADPYAAIVVWTPDETGPSDGKKVKDRIDMHEMWRRHLEGKTP